MLISMSGVGYLRINGHICCELLFNYFVIQLHVREEVTLHGI